MDEVDTTYEDDLKHAPDEDDDLPEPHQGKIPPDEGDAGEAGAPEVDDNA